MRAPDDAPNPRCRGHRAPRGRSIARWVLAAATAACASAAVAAAPLLGRGYPVGGTASGASGPGLVLSLGGTDLAIDANGAFQFPGSLPGGAVYTVQVKTHPPGQYCGVQLAAAGLASGRGPLLATAASGVASSASATEVQVACVATLPVGGFVEGLGDAGLVLSINGAGDLPVATNGPFLFAARVPAGAPYAVQVRSVPATQTCGISVADPSAGVAGGKAIPDVAHASASGVAGAGSAGAVSVVCAPDARVGGMVAGLAGSGLVLQLGNAPATPLPANGPFVLAPLVPLGAGYDVRVLANPPGQSCLVRASLQAGGAAGATPAAASAHGTASAGSASDLVVACEANPRIGGRATGLPGGGLVLRLNGVESLPIGANGAFVFATAPTLGSTYSVAVVATPQGQSCTVSTPAGGNPGPGSAPALATGASVQGVATRYSATDLTAQCQAVAPPPQNQF